MIRLRVFPGVVVRVARLIPWWHLMLGSAAAFVLAATRRAGPWTTPDEAVFGLRVAAVAVAAATAFVFDDPAVSLSEGKPVPLWLQRTARLAVALPAVAVGWWLLVGWMEAGVEVGVAPAVVSVPRLGMWVELAAMVGVVWAVATLVIRTGRAGGGMVAAPALLVFVVVVILLPERWAMFPPPAEPPLATGAATSQWDLWIDAHRRWMAVGCLAWAGVVVGLTSPWRSRVLWRPAASARVARNGGLR